MNKRHLHHVWTIARKVSYWYFLVAAIIFGFISINALRSNNLTAIKLREDLLEVDKSNGDIELALRNLRSYVYSHMNTSLASSGGVYPPIQLKYRYDRLVTAEAERVKQANSGVDVNAQAQQYCEQTQPSSFYGAGRLGCIREYIDTHPVKTEQPKAIPDSLYKFDFVSPKWTPDLAGITMVASLFSGLLFIVKLGIDRWMRHKFKSHL